MDNLYVIKGQLQQVYAKYSKFIDKGVQFILALAAFYMINHDLGFMSLLSNPLITLGLAVICAFLPMIVTSAAGAVVSIVIMAAGSAVLDVKISYPELILGNVATVIVGLILELLFFAVDYSRTESVQYEDDEYYYYVKAVPKIVVAAPEKTVKRINRRTENQETEIAERAQRTERPEKRGRRSPEREKLPVSPALPAKRRARSPAIWISSFSQEASRRSSIWTKRSGMIKDGK